MDIKKFLDQTVREVKREVNKKVLKVPEIEQKVYEATSNEPWGPHGTLMGDIAQATRNFNEYQMIMAILWKRLNDTGKNWRHVYKSLTVLEFLVANGAERIIDELREHAYQVQTLVDFQYLEPGGKDQGLNVRKKAQTLVTLLGDKERIREVRSKAAANRDKYRGVSSTGNFSKSSSYSSTKGGYGGYGDRDYDDDRYGGGSSRPGWRDDDKYGDRDRYKDDPYREDRYRDDDRSSRDSPGDRYRDDRDRERYEEDRYGSRGADGYGNDKYGDYSKNGGSSSNAGLSKDRDRNRSFDEDESYPPRRGSGSASGSKADDYGQAEREPSGLAAAVARAHTSQTNPPQSSSVPSVSNERKATATVGGSYFANQSSAAEDFDDFDPRGNFSASSAAPQEDDPFGTPSSAPAPAPAPVSIPAPPLPKSTSGIEDLFGDGGFENSFVAAPAPPSASTTGPQANGSRNQDLFGASSFTAEQAFSAPASIPAPAAAQFPPPTAPSNNGNFQAFAPVNSFEPNPSFGSSAFGGPSSNPSSINSQTAFPTPPAPIASQTTFPGPAAPPPGQTSFPNSLAPPPSYSSMGSFQNGPMGASQPPSFPLSSGSNSQAPLGASIYNSSSNAFGASFPQEAVNSQSGAVPPKAEAKPFQTKSSVWSDTINSGLIDLNISGSKTNPLVDLGIDLKDSIFSAQEKRKEAKAQPTASTMGRAMGSGTGLGRAGASAAPAPTVAGGGINMGIGMGPGMGMMPQNPAGMGMGRGVVNPGYGGVPGMGPNSGYGNVPGMGVNPGYGVPTGMGRGQNMGMNAGIGGYGQGIGMVPGGYGPGVGTNGFPNQQYGGYR